MVFFNYCFNIQQFLVKKKYLCRIVKSVHLWLNTSRNCVIIETFCYQLRSISAVNRSLCSLILGHPLRTDIVSQLETYIHIMVAMDVSLWFSFSAFDLNFSDMVIAHHKITKIRSLWSLCVYLHVSLFRFFAANRSVDSSGQFQIHHAGIVINE